MTTTGYEISFEQAEDVKNLVGKTLNVKGNRKAIVSEWKGQNLVLAIDGKVAEYPAIVILDQIKKGFMAIA
jgi:hypothetical protein